MTLLTTKDVQDLIHVDKSTIYRMAEDGRLPAVKVGRQWRFPADGIAALIGDTFDGPGTEPATTSTPRRRDLGTLLDAGTAQAVADLIADIVGVMAVVTDMDGRPLSAVANPCGFFSAVERQPGAVQRCVDGWRELGDAAGLNVSLIPSHLGFLCARAFIRIGSELAGMVIVGGITPTSWPPSEAALHRIAADTGADVDDLAAHASETYTLDDGEQARLLALLPRLTDLVSLVAASRSHEPATSRPSMATFDDALNDQRSPQ